MDNAPAARLPAVACRSRVIAASPAAVARRQRRRGGAAARGAGPPAALPAGLGESSVAGSRVGSSTARRHPGSSRSPRRPQQQSCPSPTGPPPNFVRMVRRMRRSTSSSPCASTSSISSASRATLTRNRAVGTDLGVVADALEQPVGDAGRAAGAAGNLQRTGGCYRHTQDAGRAGHDLRHCLLVVEV